MVRRRPGTVVERTAFGDVELVPDTDRPGAWTLHVDGTPQSYVDLNDPGYLEFEYVRWLAAVIDTLSEVDGPPQLLHLGGGALTLPRHVAHQHPLWVQRVVERDPELVALVRQVLPLRRGAGVRVRVGDARAVVEAARPHRYDLVLTDAFDGGRVPAPLATVEFATAVARLLRPGGWYAVNIVDGPPLRFARGQVATLCEVFGEVCLIAEPSVLRRRRYGNLVLVASTGADLPVEHFAATVARDFFPARLVYGADLVRFAGGVPPVHDDAAVDSPGPPTGLFSRRPAL